MTQKSEADVQPPTPCCGYVHSEPAPYPVMWNSWNKNVQCHNCGEVYEPLAAVPAPTLTDINDLAKVYCTSYASPHHITFTVEGLRNFLAAAPQARQEQPKPDSSYPAQPTGEAATARDAARYRWLRDVASHEWLATGPITDASVDAALSNTPTRGDDGATGADLPDGAQR